MSWWDKLTGVAEKVGGSASDFFESKSGLAELAKLGLSYGINKSGIADEEIPKTGYQGGIPNYTAVRERVPGTTSALRKPGSMGQRYFSDMTYATGPEKRPEVTPEQARAMAKKQAKGLAALNRGKTNQPVNPPVQPEFRGASSVIDDLPPTVNEMYRGGIAELSKGRYLKGSSDGMADEVAANIDGKQEAALSHGEFVIPADVVSHLGNGNSDAGAKILSTMMSKVRKSRTGNSKQGKQIDPTKFLPMVS